MAIELTRSPSLCTSSGRRYSRLQLPLVLSLVWVLAGCTGTADRPPPDPVQTIAKARPAVVAIRAAAGPVGSGFLVSADGIIITNAHVARNRDLQVVHADGSVYRWQLIRVDEEADLAAGRISASDLQYLRTRDRSPQVGESVIVLGNPFGQGVTATAGIVSAAGESIGRPGSFQTDAAINPGNSGGPVVDAEGALLGVVNARAAYGTGVGFAVDAERVNEFVESLPAR